MILASIPAVSCHMFWSKAEDHRRRSCGHLPGQVDPWDEGASSKAVRSLVASAAAKGKEKMKWIILYTLA